MANVDVLLNSKDKNVWSISPKSTVFDAIRLMEERAIGALAVIQDDNLVGIISERDYARKVFLQGRTSQETKVEDIMTGDVLFTHPDQDIEDCMVIMSEHHIRHLPVMQGKALVGMISLGDVVKQIIKDQKIKIKHLEKTITWGESY